MRMRSICMLNFWQWEILVGTTRKIHLPNNAKDTKHLCSSLLGLKAKWLWLTNEHNSVWGGEWVSCPSCLPFLTLPISELDRDYKPLLQSKLYVKIPVRKLGRSLVGQRLALKCFPMQGNILCRQLSAQLPLLRPWRSAQLFILGIEALLCFGNG